MSIENAIGEIEKRAAESIRMEPGDYYSDDGLLMCGKCNTAKQVRVNILGRERTPMCLCKCEAERRNRLEEERQQREFREQVKRMRREAFPEAELEGCTFEADDLTNPRISAIAQNYVENFVEMRKNGKGLLLYGSVGSGKSFSAACIVNALIDKGYPCAMTNFARLSNTLSGMFEGRQEYIDSLNRCALLVIDDLASERDTEYMGEIVQMVIDSRYRAGLPLIITTNLTAQELKNPAEMRKQRIYSRLFEMCVPVECSGRDRRKEKLKNEFDAYKELLGL